MGCICSKGAIRKEIKEKDPRKLSKRSVACSKRDDVVVEVDGSGNDATARLISAEPTDRSSGSTPTAWNEGEKKSTSFEKVTMPQMERASVDALGSGELPQVSRILGVRDGVDGAQVVAGWPSWLSAVAGEAIKGWIPRKADSFEKLDKIGQGTYSSVYRALDRETRKIVALKKVRFVNMDQESVRFMAREIIVLRRLDHPNVMKLEGLVTSRVSGNLYLVFEYMEHDLARLATSPAVKFTEAQIKCYMQQLVWGLEHCHNCGVLHRDIKGSNLLIDNNGILKIADFGLATFYGTSHKQPLTSRVVTLWYRPPELLLGATDYGVAVDLWSAGCILAELFAGKPIMPGRTEVEQLHKIFKLCGSPSEAYWKKSKLPHATIFKPQQPYRRCVAETFKDFPSSALKLLDALLAVEPDNRGSTSSALHSEFFTTKPLPHDPSTLPKYPPSKELDAKARDEEARRQQADAGKGCERYRNGPRSKAVPAPDANAELLTSIQKRQALNPKSCSESYNNEEDSGSGFPIDPLRGPLRNGVLHHHTNYPGQSGSSFNNHVNEVGSLLGSQREFDSMRNGTERTYRSHRAMGAAHLSRFSNSVGVQGCSRLDISSEANLNSGYNQLNDPESLHHLLGRPNSSYKKDETVPGKHVKLGYTSRHGRMHYSGPLIPAGGNIEDMLREHERQIQNAVRKARVDKKKNQKARSELGLTESLLHYGRNDR